MLIEQELAQALDPLSESILPILAFWSESFAFDKAAAWLQYWASRSLLSPDPKLPCLIIVPQKLKYQWAFLIRHFLPEQSLFSDCDLSQSVPWQDFDLILCSLPEYFSSVLNFEKQIFSWVVWDTQLSGVNPEIVAGLGDLDWQMFLVLLDSSACLVSLQAEIKQMTCKRQFQSAVVSLTTDKSQFSEQIYLLPPTQAEQGHQRQLEAKILPDLKRHLQDLGLSRSRSYLQECLTQFCLMAAHPALAQLSTAREIESCTKLDFLLRYLKFHASVQHRVLVVTRFVQTLNLLKTQLKKITTGWGVVLDYQLIQVHGLKTFSSDQAKSFQQILFYEPWPSLKPSRQPIVLPEHWQGQISYLILAGGSDEKLLRFYLRQFTWFELGANVYRGPPHKFKDYELLQCLPLLN